MVLGGFSAKEKQTPQAGLVVNLARHSAQIIVPKNVQEKISQPSPFYTHPHSLAKFSQAIAIFLVTMVAVNPLVPVFADELPPDFSDLAGTQTLSEGTTSESVILPETQTDVTTEIPATSETIETTTSNQNTSESEIQTAQEESLFEQIVSAVVDVFNPSETDETNNVIATSTEERKITETLASDPDEEEIATSTEETATSTEEVVVPSEVIATTTEEKIVTDNTAENGTFEETATTTEEEIIPTEEATTTEETIVSPEEALSTFSWPEEQTPTAQPKVFFKDNECIPTDDGGYYCVASKLGIGASTTEAATSRVYAQAGENDDKEIYYEDANGKTQITTNEYDDDSPSYDENSSIILWHALINGRYQIMFYDKSPAGIGFRQLTDTEYNNTNPYISGKSAVWQGWVNNNWEIFYVKDVTAPSLEIRQITSTVENDMFPHLSEKFITWQSFFEDTWHVFVYDMETGETSQITKTADGKYENPRFALLFEKRDENGEVKTIGYDIASGQEIPISHGGNSAPAPLSLPQADNDKALPLTSSTSTLKTVGKDGEGDA